MRTMIAILAVVLAAAPALADSDVSLRVDLGTGEGSYYYGAQWYWGDPVLYGRLRYTDAGLLVVAEDGDWAGRFSYGSQPYNYGYYYPYSYYSPGTYREVRPYEPLVKPYPPLIEPYEPLVKPQGSMIGTHPNDRGGYRMFIPRGLGGPPELYGDYVTDEYGYPVPRARGRYYGGGVYYPGTSYYYRGRPVVIHYSYGYPYYTAPSCADYGYRGGVSYVPEHIDYSYRGQGRDGVAGGGTRAEEINVYEGDVYNYYYGEERRPPAAVPEPAPPVAAAPEIAPAQTEPGPRAFGTRFYEQARLETPEGAWRFTLRGTYLFAGPEGQLAQELSSDADPHVGVFAAHVPGEGVLLLFRELGELVAAYPTAAGDWWVEPLPYDVDFDGDLTLGLVGGRPWVVFDAQDGTRYVVSFVAGSWYEVGSGTTQ